MYDDLDYVEWMMYDIWPEGFWGLYIVGHWATMKFDKPIESATTATYRTYAKVQVFNPDDVLTRVVSKSKAKCYRVQ